MQKLAKEKQEKCGIMEKEKGKQKGCTHLLIDSCMKIEGNVCAYQGIWVSLFRCHFLCLQRKIWPYFSTTFFQCEGRGTDDSVTVHCLFNGLSHHHFIETCLLCTAIICVLRCEFHFHLAEALSISWIDLMTNMIWVPSS